MTINETSAHGHIIKIGDGGVGAGTKASRTMGSANKQLIVGWNIAGTAGNSKTVEVIENGNDTPLSVTVTTSAVVINVETDGSGNSLSSVNDVIAKLYADETFATYWFATDGAGDGTDLVDADFASAALTGGAAGTEVFTEIEGIFNGPNGPGWSPRIIEAFSHSRTTPKKHVTVVDIGAVTFDLYFDSTDAQHTALLEAAQDPTTPINFQQYFTDDGEYALEYAAYVLATAQAPVEGFNVFSITLQPSDGAAPIA